ncbi:MAG: hypothetical protein NC231_05710 [Bacillus sp. (in: Bacteria)]|nr:hypothetical protein [Bacillus sp. (in: firmicutes)]MCM1425684.1 hypothetical protein [Eubacterium sp.]
MKNIIILLVIYAALYVPVGCEPRSDDAMAGQNEEYEVIENPYFPVKEHTSLKIHAEYYNQGFVDEMSSWYFKSGENMSMYLYVTADKIYWLLPYAQPEPGGESLFVWEKGKGLIDNKAAR